MKDDKKGCNCNIPDELKEKVDEVIMDNKGKSQKRNVNEDTLAEELDILNPDDALRDRG